jgi:hypothetical protein
MALYDRKMKKRSKIRTLYDREMKIRRKYEDTVEDTVILKIRSKNTVNSQDLLSSGGCPPDLGTIRLFCPRLQRYTDLELDEPACVPLNGDRYS